MLYGEIFVFSHYLTGMFLIKFQINDVEVKFLSIKYREFYKFDFFI
ncbi:hypothetical protein IFVP177_C270105 [Vibrio parahaemolyticus]